MRIATITLLSDLLFVSCESNTSTCGDGFQNGTETDLELGLEPGWYTASIYLNDSPTPLRVKEFKVN